jgi:transcriptional regulator with XRE-family HTH domain
MRGTLTPEHTVKKIRILRSKGQSINEISAIIGKSKSVVSRYIQGVRVLPEYVDILRVKQGGSKVRAKIHWAEKKEEARILITDITRREWLLILASLYWGEGTKKELNIVNSDPTMLRVVVHCLRELGIPTMDFRATLRIYGDLDKQNAIKFWSQAIGIPVECFINVNVLQGKKDGKLPYGMCRLRVLKGGKYFKLLMSLIERIKELLP